MAFKLFEKPKKKPKKNTSKKPSKPKKKPKKTVKRRVKKPVKKKVIKKKTSMKKMKPRKKVPKSKPKKITKKKVSKKKVIKKVKTKEKKIKKAKVPEIEKVPDEKAYNLVKQSRLPVLKTIFIKKEKDIPTIKSVGFPCYMKVSSAKIIHKSEVGGIVKVETMEEAEEAFKKLMKIKFAEAVLVQEFKEGFELIVGSKYDDHFGHVVSIGLGGIYVEILKDVKFGICPIAKDDAERIVKGLKGYDILAGARGKKPIDFASLYDLLVKICNFSVKNKIKEMDINPLFCNSKGCYISDIKIIK